ncbi:IS21 family transposase [Schnuerera ultunensis]|uniref:IS21 family transposase n=1 Tax=Schnuerera ultunensis TaxID=45497 RepID=UPI0003F64713|nr:IS21 family transposase [Schnuerera ultunensis]
MECSLRAQLNIIKLMDLKPNFSDLARQYGLDRRTVKKYYEGYEGKPKTRNKTSKLDKYKDEIIEKLQIKGIKVKAIYEYFLDKGYDVGGYSNFNKYIKNNDLKPTAKSKGHPRFETLPGKQAQVDWKEDVKLISKYNEEFIINVFSYKLGNSRYCHFEYKKHRTQQDVFDSLIKAFKQTGGVPKEILFDNMRTVVDIVDNRRRINTKMQAFADDFGFKISLCKPRKSYTKGKVEAANKFVEWLLAYNHDFEDEDDLISIIKNINNKVNQYVCQATGVPPILLFQKEKEYLQPLPKNLIIESYMDHELRTSVHKDSLVNYKGRKYSVPPKYIGKDVLLKQIDNQLYIYCNIELIRIHQLSNKNFNYEPEDYKSLMAQSIKDNNDLDNIVLENLNILDSFLK